VNWEFCTLKHHHEQKGYAETPSCGLFSESWDTLKHHHDGSWCTLKHHHRYTLKHHHIHIVITNKKQIVRDLKLWKQWKKHKDAHGGSSSKAL
jgi:hypothetical protein